MAWTAIVLGVSLGGVLIAYLTQPWWGRQAEGRLVLAKLEDEPAQMLADQREAVLTALRDLDFDYEVGKVTEEDCTLLRQNLLAEAAAVMTQLNTVESEIETNLDEQLEAQILAVRRRLYPEQQVKEMLPLAQSGPTCVTCGKLAYSGDVYCTGCGMRLNPTCPECGTSIQTTDYFCSGCGLELALALSG